jgi:di/tricarboxylate transporter
MNISKISTAIGIAILGVSAICIYLFADIDYQAKIAILVMMLAVILWITDWMPGVGTGFLCIILLVACGGVNSLSEGVIGFAKPICYFLIGILAIGYAVKRSGLADRVANYIFKC